MISYNRLLFICAVLAVYTFGSRIKNFDFQFAETPPPAFNTDTCAKLNLGEICTFAGNPDLGNKINPTTLRQNLKFAPVSHAADADGFFIADRMHNLVWYWNRNSRSVTRLGVTIAAREIRVVAGSGASLGYSSTMALQTQFEGLSALAYDVAKQRLYVAEREANRIRFIDSQGWVQATIEQSCKSPSSIALSESRNFLFASCSDSGAVKAWDVGSKTADNLIETENPGSIAVIGKRLFVTLPKANKIIEVVNGRVQDFYQFSSTSEKLNNLAATTKNLWVTTSQNRLLSIDLNSRSTKLSGQLETNFLSADLANTEQLIFSHDAGSFGFFNTTSKSITQAIGSKEFRFGFSGDQTLPRNQQKLKFVTGLAINQKSGELMVMDSGNCRIRRVINDEMETAVARGCGSPTIENQNPLESFLDTFSKKNGVSLAGISFMPDQSLLIANTGANSVRIWNQKKVKTFAGDFLTSGHDGDGTKALEARLKRPTYAVQDPVSKKILIADSANHCVKQLSDDGTLSTAFGQCQTKGTVTTATPDPLFDNPTAMAFDSLGNLIVADRGSQALVLVNRTGKTLEVAGIEVPAGHAARIACQPNGDLGEGELALQAECAAPTGLAVHKDRVCFSNQLSHNVRCFDLYGPNAGKVLTVAGQPQFVARMGTPFGMEQEGIMATEATLAFPSAVAFDGKGDLFIADTYNHLVRKVRLSK